MCLLLGTLQVLISHLVFLRNVRGGKHAALVLIIRLSRDLGHTRGILLPFQVEGCGVAGVRLVPVEVNLHVVRQQALGSYVVVTVGALHQGVVALAEPVHELVQADIARADVGVGALAALNQLLVHAVAQDKARPVAHRALRGNLHRRHRWGGGQASRDLVGNHFLLDGGNLHSIQDSAGIRSQGLCGGRGGGIFPIIFAVETNVLLKQSAMGDPIIAVLALVLCSRLGPMELLVVQEIILAVRHVWTLLAVVSLWGRFKCHLASLGWG